MNNSRPKTRYDHQQHPPQHYRQAHHNYVPPQGPPPNVGQARMPNAPASSMRAQGMNTRTHVNVPQQQQPQQQQQQMQGQQVQQQAHPGGVAVQQHQGYPHVSTHSHPPPQHIMYYSPHGVSGHAGGYIQISPYPISTANPGMPLHPLTQLQAYTPRYTTYTYGAAQHGQSQQGYYHNAAATTTPAHPMYSTPAVAPQYVPQPHRMSGATMHPNSQAVANAQQLQQAPVAQAHVAISAQHQPQHSHPQQQGVQVGPPQTQPLPRQEPSQERRRNRLKIVNPVTGEDVLGESTSSPAGSSSTSKAESGPAKGVSSTESAQNSLLSSTEKQDTQNQNAQVAPVSHDVKQKDETATSAKEESGNAAIDRNKYSVRTEFFQKVSQASDEARTSSSASSGSGTAANASNNAGGNQAPSETPPEEPSVEPSTPTPVPSTPTKEPSPEPSKQLVPNTPVVNTSSDDSKDASLVSISPTPIENYSNTPRRDCIASPPLQPPVEKFNEEPAEEEIPQEVTAPEVIAEPEVTTDSSNKSNYEEEVSEPVPEEVQAEISEHSDSVKQDELDVDEKTEVDEEEVIEENQQNGHVPLEDGEIRDDDDEESAVAESANEDPEDPAETVKGKIKYDREFLLKIGNTGSLNEFKVAERGLPDLARDKDSLNNHMKHGVSMSKGSPVGQRDFVRSRGMSNQGNKGNMLQMNPPHMRLGMGQLNWGTMQLPPPPPRGVMPKVQMSLQREEVKLHKAENAWKPNTLKRDPIADKNADDEAIMIESIVKKTRGILNKLTPDNFDKLVKTFMDLPLEDKDERISNVISVVFEKAIDEPSFSTAYAKMVQTVCRTSQETSKKFRKQILDQCQKEFQNSNTDEDEIKVIEQKLAEAKDDESREQLKAELDDKKFFSRRRSLGNVRFIGELYKLQMLTPKIMVECVNLLLYSPDEEKLECLCKLLATVGQKLDLHLQSLEEEANTKLAGGGKPKFAPEPKWMDRIFQQLSKLSDDKSLSSRIRFAILDVVELRQNDWKPRRDTNAPKTIEEVRKEAYRQEIEEKRQINNLPPVQNSYGGGGDRDHRTGNSRLPTGPPQQKKGDWTTVQSSKSSRFQTIGKKPDSMGPGGTPVLAPSTFAPPWASKSHSGPPMKNLPPRLQNVQSRFSNLNLDDGNRANPNKGIHNSDAGGYRDHNNPVFSPPSASAPPLISPAAASPPPSTNSSATNSRPVSPKGASETFTADTSESVKNIFQEYLQSKKFDDTLHWIDDRFSGSKIEEFIEELCRQVGEMSKEVEQKCAGNLLRLLIKNNKTSKDTVIKLMAQGVMQDLPDILIDSPMATTYLAQFLVEIFSDESNLNWLVSVGDNLIHNEDDDGSAWRELAANSINLLKLRTNEEHVQTSYKQTRKKNVIPVEEILWLQDKTPDLLAEKMVKVLGPKIDAESEELGQIFQENAWDVREEITACALTEAICTITWNPETLNWNDIEVKRLLPLLALPNQKIFPAVWKQVEDYSKRKSIDKKTTEGLWNILFSLNMTTTGSD